MFISKRDKRKQLVWKIKKLRKAGGTYREIVEYFNKNGWLTIAGFKWSAQSLHRFFKTHGK